MAYTLAEVLITLGIIGVVAAMTMPTLISTYKKHVIETRLKHSYSLLNQVIKLAQVDYDEIAGWDLSNGVETFAETYLMPYMKSNVAKKTSLTSNYSNMYTIQLLNGVQWLVTTYKIAPANSAIYYHSRIIVDINGSNPPNKQGIDRFNLYVFPVKQSIYNTGEGNCAKNVPSAGVYYDGYGYTDAELKSSSWRGCGGATNGVGRSNAENAFCIGLIIRNDWKIPKNYPIKL